MGYTRDYLNALTALLVDVSEGEVDRVVELLWENCRAGGRVVFCGNGGSASTASHLATDFQKCLFLETGRAWECLSLADSIPLLTAWGNDTDYANVFAGQARCWLRANDLLLALSGSGNSPNVLAAVEAAHEAGAITVGLCGFGGGKLARAAQHSIVVHADNMQRVEDVHMILGHVLFSAVRDRLRAASAAMPTL